MVTAVMTTASLPPHWFYCDAPYFGGAETYLQWHLEAATPEQLGLIAVARPTLLPWFEQLEARGFAVRRLHERSWRARWRELYRELAFLRPRLVHFNFPHPYDGIFGMAPLAAKFAKVERIVVTEHLPGVGKVGKRFWAKRIGVEAVDASIAVCEAHQRILTDTFHYSPAKAVTILNGVPDTNPEGTIWAQAKAPLPRELSERERGDGPRIVQLGALDPRKGGDVLIDALSRLARGGTSFQMWFVGEGPDRTRLEEQIDACGLQECVHLAGHRDDVPAILRACDLMVLASRREGMPLSLLEGLCQGLPLLATDVDGVKELLVHEENGLLVSPGDPRGLSFALGELLGDRDTRIRFGREGRRRYCEHHTLSAMTQATFAVHRGELP
jgi:glycosyltransferase involved in cell wall biosynthesis